MKYAVEMGPGAMIYKPSFITTGSGIQKLIWGNLQTHKQHGDCISLLYESRLKTKIVANSQTCVRIWTVYIIIDQKSL
jgi:hypothetical protein